MSEEIKFQIKNDDAFVFVFKFPFVKIYNTHLEAARVW